MHYTCECGLSVGHENEVIADQVSKHNLNFYKWVFAPTLNPTFCLNLYKYKVSNCRAHTQV